MPYQSFLFLETQDGSKADLLLQVVLKSVAGLARRDGAPDLDLSGVEANEEISDGFFVYRRERPASWTSDPSFTNIAHHIAILTVLNKTLACFFSDDRLRSQVESAVATGEPRPFDRLSLIPPARLNAAFVKGQIRTLWLSATHRQTSVKPDRKVLSGVDITDALNPLDDQSFFFTSARCKSSDDGRPYGISPKKSALWIGPSKDWAHYRTVVSQALQTIDGCSATEAAPLPILAAESAVPLEPGTLGEAYEMTWDQPVVPEVPAAEGELQEVEERPSFVFELLEVVPPVVRARVADAGGQPVGVFRFELSRVGKRVAWGISPDGETDNAATQRFLEANASRLRIWFDNGYLVSGSDVFSTRFQDFRFEGFEWADFDGVQITQEKPSLLAADTIGTERSLFCFVKNGWSTGALPWLDGGWLACNDGSMEIADFIHFTEDPARLTLIHVKGSHSDSTARELAVAPFEVVVAQAVKNLRQLDHGTVSGEFSAFLSTRVRDAVWHRRRRSTREAMLRAMDRVGSRAARRVIVVQPHVRRIARDRALLPQASKKQSALVKQLHTLLLSARASCAAVGADFVVVGAEE